jgi:RecG-like helicase
MGILRRRASSDGTDEPVAATYTPIAEAVARHRVEVAGQVMRMRARPTTGIPALAVTISDGTGSMVAVWTGRRAIGGIALGRRVAIEGVPTRRGDHLEVTNPAYTLLP